MPYTFNPFTGTLDYYQEAAAVGEGHITIMPHSYNSITQGSWGVTFDANQLYGGFFYNSSNAQNDQVDYKVYLDVGTYQTVFFTALAPNRAIITLLVDGASVGTVDVYSLIPNYNTQRYIPFTVTTAGLKTCSLKAATRNAAATDWYIAITYWALWRTA